MAEIIRKLIERERSRERERELLAMFNEAAADVTDEDLEEREILLGRFSSGPGDEARVRGDDVQP